MAATYKIMLTCEISIDTTYSAFLPMRLVLLYDVYITRQYFGMEGILFLVLDDR